MRWTPRSTRRAGILRRSAEPWGSIRGEPETNEGEGGVFVDDLPELFEAYEELGVDDVVLGFETPGERSLDRLERVLRSR